MFEMSNFLLFFVLFFCRGKLFRLRCRTLVGYKGNGKLPYRILVGSLMVQQRALLGRPPHGVALSVLEVLDIERGIAVVQQRSSVVDSLQTQGTHEEDLDHEG